MRRLVLALAAAALLLLWPASGALAERESGAPRGEPADGSVTDVKLASDYSGVGSCAASTWAATLTRNAGPSCTQPAFSDLAGTANAITSGMVAFNYAASSSEGGPATSVAGFTPSKCARFDGSGNLVAASGDCTAGDTTGGTPGGADTQVQFNDAGAFGGDADFTWNKTTNAGAITGQLGVDNLSLDGSTVSSTSGNLVLNGTNGLTLSGGGTPNGDIEFGGDGVWIFENAAGAAFSRLCFRNSSCLSATVPDWGGLADKNGGIWIGYSGAFVNMGAGGLFGWIASGDPRANPETSIGRVAAGVVAPTNGSVATTTSNHRWLMDTGTCVVTADQTNETTAFASSTCTVDNLVAGRNYGFTCSLLLSDSVAADGAKVDFAGGTATETYFRAHLTAFDSALNLSTPLDDLTDVAQAATFTGDGNFEVHGSFEPAAGGTFVPRFAQVAHSVGTLTLYRGSRCRMWDQTP